MLLILVEDEVPDLDKARRSLIGAGTVLWVEGGVSFGELLAVVVVDLRARSAGASIPGRPPPVLAPGETEDAVFGDSHAHPVFLRLQVLRGILVPFEDRDPESFRREL